MKVYGGVDVWIHVFLTSALAGGERSASRPGPGRFTTGEKAPSTHWIGGWVDPRAGLDDVEKRKFLNLSGLHGGCSITGSCQSDINVEIRLWAAACRYLKLDDLASNCGMNAE
jgi:hypothetical protein